MPRKRGGFAGLMAKQLMVFFALGVGIVILDLILYIVIAISAGDIYANGSPREILSELDDSLVVTDSGWDISIRAEAMLQFNDAWAIALNEEGSAIWTYEVPEGIPLEYSVADMGVVGRLGTIENYPVFLWSGNSEVASMIIVGFPIGSYSTISLQYPDNFYNLIFTYIAVILLADLLVFYIYYVLSRRKTMKSVAPISEALSNLAAGRPTQVKISGDLAEVGDQINQASEIIQEKDHARSMWIRGVSHDIRTPLSMIVGYSDVIANDPDAPDDVREGSERIRSQALKIKDLVLDLNAASRLAFDIDPLNVSNVSVSALLREIAAEHINSGGDAKHPIDLDIEASAEGTSVLGDSRMLSRAFQNLISNSCLHNESGCSIHVNVRVELSDLSGDRSCARDRSSGSNGYANWNWSRRSTASNNGRANTGEGSEWNEQASLGAVVICVSDNGKGVSPEILAELEGRITNAKLDSNVATSADGHGLGLVLVARIVWAHGGELAIDGYPNSGFAARIILPLAGLNNIVYE